MTPAARHGRQGSWARPSNGPETSAPMQPPSRTSAKANLKGVELANFAGDTVLEVADAAEQGVRRVCDDQQLAWSFLAHTGLTLDHPPPPNL